MADPGVIHVVLVLQKCRMLELGGHAGSHQDSKESPKVRQSVAGLEALWAAHERAMHEAVTVKPTQVQTPQKLDTSNVDCLQRKVVDNWLQIKCGESQTKCESPCVL